MPFAILSDGDRKVWMLMIHSQRLESSTLKEGLKDASSKCGTVTHKSAITVLRQRASSLASRSDCFIQKRMKSTHWNNADFTIPKFFLFFYFKLCCSSLHRVFDFEKLTWYSTWCRCLTSFLTRSAPYSLIWLLSTSIKKQTLHEFASEYTVARLAKPQALSRTTTLESDADMPFGIWV